MRLAVALAAVALSGAAHADDLKVVATFSILGDMVGEVGGDSIALTTLVGPDGDAHVYQPTPADARAISDADLLVVNGLEFEGWIERLIEASGYDGPVVVAAEGIDAIAFAEGEAHGHAEDHAHAGEAAHQHEGEHADAEEAGHAHEGEHAHAEEAGHAHEGEQADAEEAGHAHEGEHAHGEEARHEHGHGEAAHGGEAAHDHGAYDPHAWQSLDNARVYIANIAEALSAADPEGAGAYGANRDRYLAEVEALKGELEAAVAALPEGRRTVVSSHDAFGYLEAWSGIRFLSPHAGSTDAEASAQDVAALIRQIREEGIDAIFLENVSDQRLMDRIAAETGAAVGGTLYSDALSGPEGPASTYLQMMRHNVLTLTAALGS